MNEINNTTSSVEPPNFDNPDKAYIIGGHHHGKRIAVDRQGFVKYLELETPDGRSEIFLLKEFAMSTGGPDAQILRVPFFMHDSLSNDQASALMFELLATKGRKKPRQ